MFMVARWWEMSVRVWKRLPVIGLRLQWDTGPHIVFETLVGKKEERKK